MTDELNPVLKAMAWDELVRRANARGDVRLGREIDHITKKLQEMADGKHWRDKK